MMDVYVLMYSSREENPVCLGVFKTLDDAENYMKNDVDEVFERILNDGSVPDVEIDDGVAHMEYKSMFHDWIVEKSTIR